jgi:single-stranded DNA-binding protein
VPQKKWGRKRRHFHVLLELSNDRGLRWSRPGAASSAEQRFEIHRSFRRDTTLLENAEDEWVSKVEWHRIAIFRPRLAESVLNGIRKGAHVLVEGSLVSSTYEQANGKGKKAKTAKITSWSIRADVVRKLDRGEPEPQTPASNPDAAMLPSDASDPAPF